MWISFRRLSLSFMEWILIFTPPFLISALGSIITFEFLDIPISQIIDSRNKLRNTIKIIYSFFINFPSLRSLFLIGIFFVELIGVLFKCRIALDSPLTEHQINYQQKCLHWVNLTKNICQNFHKINMILIVFFLFLQKVTAIVIYQKCKKRRFSLFSIFI